MDPLVLLFIALAPLAEAYPSVTSCSTGDAPAAYDGYNCRSICQSIPVPVQYVLECDLTNQSGSSGGYLWLVSDYDESGGDDYSAWGIAEDGLGFCCYIEGDNHLQYLWNYGTDQDDTMSFTYLSDTLERDGTIVSWAGDDYIGGSVDSSAEDNLDGNGGYDTIVAVNGPAHIEGGNQGDTITSTSDSQEIYGEGGQDDVDAGSGADTIYGGDNNDTLRGGTGNDLVAGEAGADNVIGDDGNDSLYGGDGNDVVCGGDTDTGGADFLSSGNVVGPHPTGNADKLFSKSSAATPSGNAYLGSNTCGHTAHGSSWAGANCTYNISSEPSECTL